MPLDGGEATEIVRENVDAIDVSPDGRRLAFVTAKDSTTSIFVTCDLPLCSDRRELTAPPNFASLVRWTPDGGASAYVDTSFRSIWAVPVDGGAPRAIATYAPDTSPIARFAWSDDGRRLAFSRLTLEFDIVLLSGLRP